MNTKSRTGMPNGLPRMSHADVRAVVKKLGKEGWVLTHSHRTSHVTVKCPKCGVDVVGVPNSPGTGRWMVKVQSATRKHSGACWR